MTKNLYEYIKQETKNLSKVNGKIFDNATRKYYDTLTMWLKSFSNYESSDYMQAYFKYDNK